MKNIGVTDRLSFLILGVFYSITFLVGYLHVSDRKNEENKEILDSKKLIHLVLIQFQSSMSSSDFQLITDSAYSLQQIRGVKELNFGKNTSPEGLNNGYTHSLTMKFSSAHDRDSIYLPHEIHQKFVKLFLPFTESVLVYDYWE